MVLIIAPVIDAAAPIHAQPLKVVSFAAIACDAASATVAMACATVPITFTAGSSIVFIAMPTDWMALAAACHSLLMFLASLVTELILPVFRSIEIGSMPNSANFSLIFSTSPSQ